MCRGMVCGLCVTRYNTYVRNSYRGRGGGGCGGGSGMWWWWEWYVVCGLFLRPRRCMLAVWSVCLVYVKIEDNVEGISLEPCLGSYWSH